METDNMEGGAEKCSADEYFDSYEDLEIHRLMLVDRPRTLAYRDAIQKNEHLFKDKTVMDIGAGTGILSLFCMKAGAKKVYAVEASKMAGPLRKIVKLNDPGNVIEVVEGRAEDIELPSKVDIIVSEWMGFYLLHESMLDSVIKARDKHLDDDGLMFPSHARLLIAPCELKDLYAQRFQFWDDVYGFNMAPLKEASLEGKFQKNEPEVMTLDPNQLLSDPVTVREFDLRWVDQSEVSEIVDRKFVSVTRPGVFHGLCLFFSVEFHPILWNSDEVNVNPVELSTAPEAEATHWKQTVVVIPAAETVEEDDIIGWELSLSQSEEKKRQYVINVRILDPAEDEHPRPCGCQEVKCALIKALMDKEENMSE